LRSAISQYLCSTKANDTHQPNLANGGWCNNNLGDESILLERGSADGRPFSFWRSNGIIGLYFLEVYGQPLAILTYQWGLVWSFVWHTITHTSLVFTHLLRTRANPKMLTSHCSKPLAQHQDP
jgi:hypothetical protein